MHGLVIHAPGDLRLEEMAEQKLGPRDVRVRIERGGICGSDLHYFQHGGTGTIRLSEPMVLGHEIAGVVVETGAEVSQLASDQRVAVNPSQPCGICAECRRGRKNHCTDMRFMGSAMRLPHVQGGFRELLVVDEAHAVPLADTVSMAEAAMAEPLAVSLHAARRAGSLMGRRVLVTGCGPIGALIVIVARLGGAAGIVATDVADLPLATARRCGADRTIDIAADPAGLSEEVASGGSFDVAFEASGNASGLAQAIAALSPRGILVQVGLGDDMPLPVNSIVTREIDLCGSFRFVDEFDLAVGMMNGGRIDTRPVLTATLPVTSAAAAFQLAGNRSRAIKVQLDFT